MLRVPAPNRPEDGPLSVEAMLSCSPSGTGRKRLHSIKISLSKMRIFGVDTSYSEGIKGFSRVKMRLRRQFLFSLRIKRTMKPFVKPGIRSPLSGFSPARSAGARVFLLAAVRRNNRPEIRLILLVPLIARVKDPYR